MNSSEAVTVRPAYKVPSGIRPGSFTERLYDGPQGTLVLQYPDLTPELMADITRELSVRRREYLARLRTEQIVERLDLAVRQWLDPDYELRRLAEAWLPVITGYDGEMIRLELKRFFRTFRRKELLRFLDVEFDARRCLMSSGR